jgi:hypothetical protein
MSSSKSGSNLCRASRTLGYEGEAEGVGVAKTIRATDETSEGVGKGVPKCR